MELFIIQNKIVRPTVEVLLITPFDIIWERDSNSDKSFAIKEFSYIEFMCSPKKTNPFYGYDEKLRSQKIIENIFKNNTTVVIRGTQIVLYEPDRLVLDAIEVYREFFYKASPSLQYLESALEGSKKVQMFFKTVDLTLVNKAGSPIYKPSEVTRGLKDSFDVMKSLEQIREKVEQELYDTVKIKGGKDVGMYER